MIKRFSISLAFLIVNSLVYSGTIVLEGKYQNKNLFIQNPSAANGVGFCAYEILINGQVTTDEITSKTFEIDFSALLIKQGSNVLVEIRHKSDCAPKILNPDVLKPRPTFELINISIDTKGFLSWSTVNELESIPYVVEQFRWNKWVKVGEINGKGSKSANTYYFQTMLHSGLNKFRVKQVGFDGEERISEITTIKSELSSCTFKYKKDKSEIQFSTETLFEVFDMYGNLMRYGYGTKVNVNSLASGTYFLCYDNIVTEFKK